MGQPVQGIAMMPPMMAMQVLVALLSFACLSYIVLSSSGKWVAAQMRQQASTMHAPSGMAMLPIRQPSPAASGTHKVR